MGIKDQVQDDFRRPLVSRFSGLSEYNYKAHPRRHGLRRLCAYNKYSSIKSLTRNDDYSYMYGCQQDGYTGFRFFSVKICGSKSNLTTATCFQSVSSLLAV